jgi:cysteine desulfurase
MSAAAEPIYLDCNATTPILPEVVEAMRACWAMPALNSSSQHQHGRRARQLLEDTRERIAELLGARTSGADPDRVIFTSGGTESNNLAIRGLLRGAATSLPAHGEVAHLIVSAIEHPSVTSLADKLERQGHVVDRLPVGAHGIVCSGALAQLLRHDSGLVAVILGQNETGVLQPVTELAALCAARGVPLHTDATQVAGKLPISFHDLGASTMTIAAHKFHGPVGIGALVSRSDVRIEPQLFGGFQQSGLRPGTEPVALAVGMCRALELWHAEREERAARMRTLRDRLESALLAGWAEAVVIGGSVDRLPHTSQIAFVGLDRQALLMALDQSGVACSTGSACASGSSEPSPILMAMGCPPEIVASALRFSLGATTTVHEVDEAARRILAACNRLRRLTEA